MTMTNTTPHHGIVFCSSRKRLIAAFCSSRKRLIAAFCSSRERLIAGDHRHLATTLRVERQGVNRIEHLAARPAAAGAAMGGC
jgi:hypothetical protein